jgi:hypothetical protein
MFAISLSSCSRYNANFKLDQSQCSLFMTVRHIFEISEDDHHWALLNISGDRALDEVCDQKHGGFDVTIDLFSWRFPLTRGSNVRGRQSSTPPDSTMIYVLTVYIFSWSMGKYFENLFWFLSFSKYSIIVTARINQ